VVAAVELYQFSEAFSPLPLAAVRIAPPPRFPVASFNEQVSQRSGFDMYPIVFGHLFRRQGRLAKFNGCVADRFAVHLNECEFRYNHRNEDILLIVKKLFAKFQKC